MWRGKCMPPMICMVRLFWLVWDVGLPKMASTNATCRIFFPSWPVFPAIIYDFFGLSVFFVLTNGVSPFSQISNLISGGTLFSNFAE